MPRGTRARFIAIAASFYDLEACRGPEHNSLWVGRQVDPGSAREFERGLGVDEGSATHLRMGEFMRGWDDPTGGIRLDVAPETLRAISW